MHSFSWLSNIPLPYVPQLLYPFICQWTSSLFLCSSFCKQCCNEQWDTCVFFSFDFQGYMPRSGIAGSYGHFSSSFLRNLHTVFHSESVNLHPHQQCKSILFSPHPLQHLLFVDFLVIAILTDVRWYLIVVLACITIIRSNIDHLFMCFVSHLCVFFGEMSV